MNRLIGNEKNELQLTLQSNNQFGRKKNSFLEIQLKI